jgi:hypothetical protein
MASDIPTVHDAADDGHVRVERSAVVRAQAAQEAALATAEAIAAAAAAEIAAEAASTATAVAAAADRRGSDAIPAGAAAGAP